MRRAGHRIRSKSSEREGSSELRSVGREKCDDAEEERGEGRAGKEAGSSRCRWERRKGGGCRRGGRGWLCGICDCLLAGRGCSEIGVEACARAGVEESALELA